MKEDLNYLSVFEIERRLNLKPIKEKDNLTINEFEDWEDVKEFVEAVRKKNSDPIVGYEISPYLIINVYTKKPLFPPFDLNRLKGDDT